MAVAFDAGSNSGNNLISGTTNTVSHTCGASANVLVVGTMVRDSTNAVTSLTYNGVALTNLGATNMAGGDFRIELWYLLNPTTGSAQDIVATWAASEVSSLAASSYSAGYAVANYNSATGSGVVDPTLTVNISSAVNDMVVDIATLRFGNSITVDASQTQVANMTPANQKTGMSYEAGAASVTMSWTSNTGGIARQWGIAGISISGVQPATGSGARKLTLLNVG